MTKSNFTPMLIVGSGAMACLFAARLSASGIPVTMLGSWEGGLQALEHYGVRIKSAEGGAGAYGENESAYAVKILRNTHVPVLSGPVPVLSGRDSASFSYALVLVKSWQTSRVALQLSECLAQDGVALTLQNGIGNREILASTLGVERVALGVTTYGATLLEAGLVRPAGEGLIQLESHPRLSPVIKLLQQAGFQVETTPDTIGLVWGKLVINAAINPLTALLGVPNGELLRSTPTRNLLSDIARESAHIAASLGIELPYPDPIAMVESVALRTSANRSSMLQDIERGAPTEIDAICGAIVQAGERVGIPAPINRVLWQLIKSKVKLG